MRSLVATVAVLAVAAGLAACGGGGPYVEVSCLDTWATSGEIVTDRCAVNTYPEKPDGWHNLPSCGDDGYPTSAGTCRR